MSRNIICPNCNIPASQQVEEQVSQLASNHFQKISCVCGLAYEVKCEMVPQFDVRKLRVYLQIAGVSFERALEDMRAGEWARLPDWKIGTFLQIVNRSTGPIFVYTTHCSVPQRSNQPLTADELLSKKWEIWTANQTL